MSDIVGTILGAILAFYGISLTTFEERDDRLYYRPNNWIGIIVIFVFLFRFVYRFYAIFALVSSKAGASNNLSTLGHSWADGLLLIMFAYYVIYYFTLLKREKQSHEKNMS